MNQTIDKDDKDVLIIMFNRFLSLLARKPLSDDLSLVIPNREEMARYGVHRKPMHGDIGTTGWMRPPCLVAILGPQINFNSSNLELEFFFFFLCTCCPSAGMESHETRDVYQANRLDFHRAGQLDSTLYLYPYIHLRFDSSRFRGFHRLSAATRLSRLSRDAS